MALVNCSECGNEVSDKAPACPKCGNPFIVAAPAPVTAAPIVEKPTATPKRLSGKAVAFLLIFGGIVIYFGAKASHETMQPDSQADSQPAPGQPVSASSDSVVAPAANAAASEAPAAETPPPPPPPTHNYVMTENGEYGYQPVVSDDERSKGVVTKALVMVRYRGLIDGAYTAEVPGDEGAVYRMECKDPCEFVKTKVILNGAVLKTETLQNAPESLVGVIFQDAIAGQLTPYSAKSSAN